MNRRVSILCLILMAAGAVLFATAAPAAEEPLDLHSYGWWVCTDLTGYPVIECYAVANVEPNAFGITLMRVYFKANMTTREMWDGRDIYLTADGNALYARFQGHLAYDGVPMGYTQEFVGGTGPFAGARGTATHECHPVFLSPVHGTSDCESHGSLVLADLQSKMVPMVSREGDLVSREVHDSAELLGFLGHKDTYTGLATYAGLYSNSKLTLLDLGTMCFYGFFTKTAADGDTMDGYYEGDLSLLPEYPDALGVDMQLWITGGTGRFENASGKETGSGISWDDGREDITLEGLISSVGSSMR